MRQHRDALGAERLRHRCADRRVLAEQQRVAGKDRDVAAEAGESLRQFHRDDRRSDNGQPRRDAVARERLSRGPVRRLCQSRNGRDRRARPGGDQAPIEGDQALAVIRHAHFERVGVLEARLPMNDRDGWYPSEHLLILAVAQLRHAPPLLREQAWPVDDRWYRRQSRIERAFAAHVGNMRRTDQDLGRHAPHIDARSSDDAALDHRDAGAELGRFQRRRHRAAAAADDGDARRSVTIAHGATSSRSF